MHAAGRGSSLNDLDAFRTINFTEAFQNIKRISHAHRDVLALKNLFKNTAQTH